MRLTFALRPFPPSGDDGVALQMLRGRCRRKSRPRLRTVVRQQLLCQKMAAAVPYCRQAPRSGRTPTTSPRRRMAAKVTQ